MTTKEKILATTVAVVLVILIIIMTCFHAFGGDAAYDGIIYFITGSLFGMGCGIIFSILRSEN